MGSSMELANPKASPPLASTFSSHTVGFLLTRRILAWSQATGLPPSVRVRVGAKTFHLHKSLLVLKCGYFEKALAKSLEADLPDAFPGGPETFEKVALFVYGSPTPFDPSTVAATRCAAEFLGMTEDQAAGNLCERSDLYLNQVVLQSWDDTLVVLRRCQPLLPWSERLLVVSRCVESLAFMACMEILDPEQRRPDRPAAALKALAGRLWNCDAVGEVADLIAGRELWIRDLVALPFPFFRRIVGSLRRQGMKEKYVSPLVVFYASKWVISEKKTTQQLQKNSGDQSTTIGGTGDKVSSSSNHLDGLIELLPAEASGVIPVGFYLALLSKALGLGVGDDSRRKLQKQIAVMLHTAQVTDLLLPETGEGRPTASTAEVEAMEKVFSMCASANRSGSSGYMEETSSSRSTVVAELWDCYLTQIAGDRELRPRRFTELIEVVPISDRDTHDHLYRAMDMFLLNHPELSSEEKASVCNYLDCRKLSEETCIRAVQNDLMPLRLIVQALFVQQLNTQQVFRDCSGGSFRSTLTAAEYLSGSLSSARSQLCKMQDEYDVTGESPIKLQVSEGFEEDAAASGVSSLGFLLRRDITAQRTASDLAAKAEYESASFRILTLEQDLRSMRRSLRRKELSTGRVPAEHPSFRAGAGLEKKAAAASAAAGAKKKRRKKEEQAAQVAGSCIASLSWGSQRKCARRLLKMLRRITMWGGGRSKRQQQVTAGGRSDGSVSCRSNHLNELYDW